MSTPEDLGIDLPPGRSGNVKTICPECQRNGSRHNLRDRSLSFDTHTGLFHCHYCGWKGKTGSRSDSQTWGLPVIPRVYRTPDELPVSTLPSKAAAFFTERKISMAAVEKRGITVGTDGGIKFPYFRNGELVNIKTRYPGKKFSLEAECELVFCGLDECFGAEQVVICEGECDLLAFETVGVHAVLSVPNGANTGKMEYMSSAETIFEECHTVVIAVDSDEKGKLLEAELARRIGKEKCFRTVWPDGCKDANDVLMQHGEDKLRSCLAEALPYPIAGIVNPRYVYDEYMALYRQDTDRGLSTGWASLDSGFTIKPGQVTIVGGHPGSGKSEVLDALMINLGQKHDWRFAVYSPENHPPEIHLRKWAKKIAGKPFYGPFRMTEDEAIAAHKWSADHLDFIIPEDDNSLASILALARAVVYRNGIKVLVIDPWNNMDHQRPAHMSETEYISQSLTVVRDFARRNDVHVFILAHPTKLQKGTDGKYPVPTPYDLAGSANWFNKADNILAVYRDKEDEHALVEIHVQKIRFSECGSLGMCSLRYSIDSGNYIDVGEWRGTR